MVPVKIRKGEPAFGKGEPIESDEQCVASSHSAVLSSSPAMLTEEVAALAASLNIASTTGTQPYEPDAFMQAIRRAHDELADVRRKLTRQHEQQKSKEASLADREAAVAFRETRCAAWEQLHGMNEPKAAGGLVRRFLRWL